MGYGMFARLALKRRQDRQPAAGQPAGLAMPWTMPRTLARVMVLGSLLLGPALSAPATAAPTPATQVPSNADAVKQLIAGARMWRNKFRNDLALEMVQKALLISPNDPNALAELGLIEIRSNRLDEASRVLFRLRSLSPDADATRELGYAYMAATTGKQTLSAIYQLSRNNQSAEAVQQLQALFAQGPPSGDLAGQYYSILAADPPHRAAAILALRRIVARDPNNFDAILTLASLLGRDSATRMESVKLAQSLALNPDADHSASLNLWRRMLRNAGPDPAYLDSQQAYLTAVPDDTEFRDLQAATRAALAARRKLEADPVWQAQQQGLKLLERGALAEAEPLLMNALPSRGNDPELLGGLGLLRMRQGRHIEARALFLEAARLDPAGRSSWQSLARTALFWGTLSQGREAIAQGHPQQAEQAARSALSMQPDSPYARKLLVDAWIAQHRWAEAEPVLRQMLNDPNQAMDALRSLTTLLHDSGRGQEIDALMATMQHRLTGADQIAWTELRSEQLADAAERLLAQGKTGPAIEQLEASIRLAPTAAWNRFSLARTYQKLGLPQLGSEVMNQGFGASQTPEMAYATALYRNSVDDLDGALAALGTIPDTQRTDAMRRLADNLQAQQLLAQAQQQFNQGNTEAGANSLNQAALLVPDDPDMLATLGKQWITQGQAERGLGLVQTWLDAHPDDPAPDVRLRYGDLLANANRETALTAWLEQLRQIKGLTPEQSARLEDQSLRQALRRTDTAIAAHAYGQADTILHAVNPAGRADPRWWLELADLRRNQRRYAEARAAVASVLSKTPGNLDAKLTLARIDEQSGKRAQALKLVRQVVQEAQPDDVDTRLSAARRLVALRQPLEADSVVAALREQFPANPDVTLQHGRVLQSMGLYDAAQSAYQSARLQETAANVTAGPDGTPAQSALFDLDQRRQPLVETAFYPSYKSGTEGVSALREQAVPLYVQIPQGYSGHWFFHADTVHLAAGTLDPDNPGAYFSDASSVGTFAAHPSNTTFSATPGAANVTLLGPLQQQATGVAVGVGFEADNWRADLGTTPIGFPVQNVVGGFKFTLPSDSVNLSINLSRRPVTSSMLSYAGLHDPVTNLVYGGVVRSGADIYASKDFGNFSLFAALGAGVLTGRNVETNQSETLRTGIDVPLVAALNWRLDTGLVGNYWHYAQNLRFYTFGQGGYYSPQRYLSLGVPLDWAARYNKASWELYTSLGWSHTFEAGSPFFPTNPALQADALANSVNNTNSASSGGGISYSVSAIFQYLMTPHLTGGFRVSIDRSHDYAPTTAMAYLRYTFNPGRGEVAFPRAVALYSDY